MSGGAAGHGAPGTGAYRLQEHFADLAQQTHAARLGVWVFLASEILFFGVLITVYAAARSAHPAAFRQGAGETDLMLGTVMTYLLLTASFLVALAVGAIRLDRHVLSAALLAGAAAIGVVFLVLKIVEYRAHFADGLYPGMYYAGPARDPGVREFFTLYYLTTGLHFLHVAIGIVLLLGVAVAAAKGRYGAQYHTPLELGGMYWHFVDMVWLFLWPMFYLWR